MCVQRGETGYWGFPLWVMRVQEGVGASIYPGRSFPCLDVHGALAACALGRHSGSVRGGHWRVCRSVCQVWHRRWVRQSVRVAWLAYRLCVQVLGLTVVCAPRVHME